MDSKQPMPSKRRQTDIPQQLQPIRAGNKRLAPHDYSSGRLKREFYDSPWIIRGLYLFILLNSLTYPILAFVMIELQVQYLAHSNDDDFKDDLSMLFGAFALAMIVNTVLQIILKYLFRELVHQIETRVRNKLVKSILAKDFTWFDRAENKPEELARIITEDVG